MKTTFRHLRQIEILAQPGNFAKAPQELNISLPAQRVIRTLDRIIDWRGKPVSIHCDNGPEYISITLKNWSRKHNININYIQPGNPQQNAYVERYNRTVRYKWLNQYHFSTLDEMRCFATKWLWIYHNEKPRYGQLQILLLFAAKNGRITEPWLCNKTCVGRGD